MADTKGYKAAVAKADKKYKVKTAYKGNVAGDKKAGMAGYKQISRVTGKRGKEHAGRLKAHARAVSKAGAKYGVHGKAGYGGGSAG